jgi:alpha-D-ribose 1-methylphosphonate 5-triphosphate synthase subunit PhnL
MSVEAAPSAGFRLAAGRVVALLGPDAARRGLLARLEPGGAQGVLTVTSARSRGVQERVAALRQAAAHRPVLVLVDRLTDGLAADDRRTVLAEVRALAAAGPAVLVDDADPVAVLAVADAALRAGLDGSIVVDDLAARLR